MSVAANLIPRGLQAYRHTPSEFRASARSHVGCVRSLNEDAWLNRAEDGLWAVADGMGGHAAGDMASREVIQHLAKVTDFSSAFALRRGVRNALFTANAVLQEFAATQMLETVGSTAVVLMAYEGHYACTWAGDSRAYLFRAGALNPITTDHTLVQELMSKGAMSGGEARSEAGRNIITRAVGARSTLDLDSVYGRIEPGDRFLLCSDGLFNALSDEEICSVLRSGSEVLATDRLIDGALGTKASDNITCLVVDARV